MNIGIWMKYIWMKLFTGWWLTYSPEKMMEFVRLDHHPQSAWGK